MEFRPLLSRHLCCEHFETWRKPGGAKRPSFPSCNSARYIRLVSASSAWVGSRCLCCWQNWRNVPIIGCGRFVPSPVKNRQATRKVSRPPWRPGCAGAAIEDSCTMPRPDIERAFAGLRGSGYAITSPATSAYNCAAWAAAETVRCWDPKRQAEATSGATVTVSEDDICVRLASRAKLGSFWKMFFKNRHLQRLELFASRRAW